MRDGDFANAETLLAGDSGGVAKILGRGLTAWARVGQQDPVRAQEALKDAKKCYARTLLQPALTDKE